MEASPLQVQVNTEANGWGSANRVNGIQVNELVTGQSAQRYDRIQRLSGKASPEAPCPRDQNLVRTTRDRAKRLERAIQNTRRAVQQYLRKARGRGGGEESPTGLQSSTVHLEVTGALRAHLHNMPPASAASAPALLDLAARVFRNVARHAALVDACDASHLYLARIRHVRATIETAPPPVVPRSITQLGGYSVQQTLRAMDLLDSGAPSVRVELLGGDGPILVVS